MLLIKLISSLIMPVGLLLLVLGVLLAAQRRSLHKGAKALILVTMLLLYVLSSYFGELLLVNPLEKRALQLKNEQAPADLVIVLAGSMPMNIGGAYENSSVTLMRLNAGYLASLQTNAPIIVTGEFLGDNHALLSSVMRDALLAWGVPEDQVLVENQARNTWEHAVYCEALIEALPEVKTIAIATSASHMQRSITCFETYLPEYRYVAAPTDFRFEPFSLLQLLPSASHLKDVEAALHEYVGLLWYRIRYFR